MVYTPLVNPLKVDEATGFLDAGNTNAFGSNRKVQFLELCKEFKNQGKFPKVSTICDMIGINITTFERHLQQDENFKHAWDEIATHIEYQCISDMHDLRMKNPMYMFGMLRYLNPKRWNPNETTVAPTGNISIYVDNVKQVQQYRDAEIVPEKPAISPQVTDSSTVTDKP